MAKFKNENETEKKQRLDKAYQDSDKLTREFKNQLRTDVYQKKFTNLTSQQKCEIVLGSMTKILKKTPNAAFHKDLRESFKNYGAKGCLACIQDNMFRRLAILKKDLKRLGY